MDASLAISHLHLVIVTQKLVVKTPSSFLASHIAFGTIKMGFVTKIINEMRDLLDMNRACQMFLQSTWHHTERKNTWRLTTTIFTETYFYKLMAQIPRMLLWLSPCSCSRQLLHTTPHLSKHLVWGCNAPTTPS